MKRTVSRTFWVVLCTLAVFALPALADSQVRIVRLSYLNGSVQIDRNTGQGFERAIMNMPISQGTQLKTQDGQAEVEFENGSTVRLAPETQVSFDGLALRDDGTKVSSMTVQDGVAYFDLNHKNKNEFKLQFAGRDLDLKKSAHFRVDVGREQVRIAVFSGDVELAGPGKRETVKKNETFSFDPADQTRFALAKGIDEYQFDSWDRQREQYQNQYAQVSYGGRGAPYYGWDDMNYYGAFSYIPGWGYMWRPFGVGYGWDPYALGYWVWYPSFGYTWVSPYAWGWTPYRYGGWNFVSGYGWCWRPGPWRGWNTITPVHNPPQSWRPPHPPSAARGGIIEIGQPHPVPHAPASASFFDGGYDRMRLRGATVPPLATPNVVSGTVGDSANIPARRFDAGRPTSPMGITPGNPRMVAPDNTRNVPRPERRFTPPPAPPSTPPAGTANSVGRGMGNTRPSGGASMSGAGRSSGGFGGASSMGGAGRTGGGSMGGGSMHSGGGGGGGHAGGGGAGGRSPR